MDRRSDVRMSWPVVNVATAVPAAGTPLVSYRMTLSDLQGHHHHHRGKNSSRSAYESALLYEVRYTCLTAFSVDVKRHL